MNSHRRTKIVATIGPATRSVESMVELIEAGADVFRFNFSHGTRAEHAENVAMAREAAERSGKEVGILGDLPGPKLRIGDVEDGIVGLRPGSEIVLTTERLRRHRRAALGLLRRAAEAVRTGGEVYLADGRIRLRVLEAGDDEVRCSVEVGGRVASHQGLNLPGADVGLPAAGREDLAWVDFAVEQGIDLLAVSFVRRAEDLGPGRAPGPHRRRRHPGDREDREAAGGRARRGDRQGGDRRDHGRPRRPRDRAADRAGPGGAAPAAGARRASTRVPSITATQMLASMVASPRPTRAEVSDVANAIFQGTDAVMLSEETAVGEYPVEAVRVMDRIARETEPDLPYGDWVFNRVASDDADVASSVARAAVGSTYTLGLAAIVVPTRSGRTARLVSAHRPRVPVLAISPRLETVRRLNLLFGVQCAIAEEWTGLTRAARRLRAGSRRSPGVAKSGDLIGITAGLPQQELGTNLFEVHRVP